MSNRKDDFLGGYFDFNGDGTTSLDEEIMGMAILNNIDDSLEDSDEDDDSMFNEDL
jgi:hypothetical protein